MGGSLTIWAASGDRVLLLGCWIVPDASEVFGEADPLARVVAALCEMGVVRTAEALWVPMGLVWALAAMSDAVEVIEAKRAIYKLLAHSKWSHGES